MVDSYLNIPVGVVFRRSDDGSEGYLVNVDRRVRNGKLANSVIEDALLRCTLLIAPKTVSDRMIGISKCGNRRSRRASLPRSDVLSRTDQVELHWHLAEQNACGRLGKNRYTRINAHDELVNRNLNCFRLPPTSAASALCKRKMQNAQTLENAGAGIGSQELVNRNLNRFRISRESAARAYGCSTCKQRPLRQIPGNPSHWCAIPELRAANWTDEQIKNVSSADSCAKYDFNYSSLAHMEYKKALEYANQHKRNVSKKPCTGYIYADDVQIKSMVEEWDLVCDSSTKRAGVHMSLSLGKLLGAGLLGASADKYGRRGIYTLGILMFVVAGPASALVPWYWGFIFLRLVTGVSFSAIQFSALTTLTEVASSRHRQWMAIVFNCGFASGSIFVAGIAYLATAWRQVQIATSLPALILLLFMWFMPESPRWLIARGRRKEARTILEKYYGPIKEDPERSNFKAECQNRIDNQIDDDEGIVSAQMRGLKIIFSNGELRKRALITCFTWMTASLTYYALALNVDNISVDYYWWAVLMGLTEIPAYLLPSPVLMFVGRRKASSTFFFISGLILVSILSISRTEIAILVFASLVGRFALSVAYGIVILYTSEFFPTITRNSALGASSAMAHVGSIIAPYSVVALGEVAWWGPSTLCGSLALVAGFLCLSLPETRNRPLADNIEDELAPGRGRVSLTRCCCSCGS
ncbi:hypothetical protein QAD02_016450 [Eretmocerus hayati]|uniref:Uncharacterized protein n=1 Tax=Eretmocerus hayati TaxID=131215 RepID=A0ACC2PB45_9HYME|nr:hypothetical protein QAD02_016450 [Eretmocerus hayati]